ncbi:MAG TPA: A24 family peptidase [Terriglobales bacterium]|jgi:prepilin peptidase CpaA|nr:A24 family peptidase [Terriglobales bacterium]
MGMVTGVWILAAVLAITAGWTDWRSRRIPNWLTVSGLILGLAVRAVAFGWAGAKDALLGAGLGLLLLLPFVMMRALGAGDWKLAGAFGAFLGPGPLITVLFGTILVNGLMAAVMVVRKGRVRETLRNLALMVAAVFTLRMPGPDLTLDNPDLIKVPFGVAFAIAVILFIGGKVWQLY